MSTFVYFWSALAILLGGSLLILINRRNALSGLIALVAMLAAGVLTLAVAVLAWNHGTISTTVAGFAIAGFPALPIFAIDRFSALFLGIIGFLGIASVLYSRDYLPSIPGGDVRRYYLAFLLFIMGMILVVSVADIFYFLLFWEFMTLASYFLVVYEQGNERNLRAGWTYFFMTHLTSIGLLLVVMMLGGWANSYAYADLPAVYQTLLASNPAVLHLIIGLLFIAFATKAGIFPLGFWLPEAYRSAPASTSAVLSGVMSKLALYGLLRFTYWMLPGSSVTTLWGMVAATAGVASMIVGNLRTLGESDAKRLVAQSSIGQMGYIWLGIGIGLMFMATNPVLSMLGLVGGLFHLINHACFKSLLFFNTGSIEYASGQRDLNRLSGLIRIIPLTAGAALIASLSIAGVPPLNGFASKWMLYQAAILGGQTTPILGFYAVVALFISTVSLAAYLKFFGPAFLGPELPHSTKTKSLPFSMRFVEGMLALVCVLLGLVPAVPVALSAGALGVRLDSAGLSLTSLGGIQTSPVQGVFGQVSPLLILLALLFGCLISYGIYRLAKAPRRAATLWSCGEVVEEQELLYRADSFYLPFKEHFRSLYRTRTWRPIKLPEQLARFLDLDRIYLPLGRQFMSWSRRISHLHRGLFQQYLFWQILGLGMVLIGLFWLLGG